MHGFKRLNLNFFFPVSVKAASLTPLVKIEVISVVDDAELLPKAILDCCWEKLLKKKSEEWSGLL